MAGASALLEVVAGRAAGMTVVVDDELVVGRNAEGAGKLAEDGELSRSHARIAIDGNGFCAVEDLGSTNGTFVNGLRITTPQTLSQGDTIELGGTTLVVRELPSVQAQPSGAAAASAPAADAAAPAPQPAGKTNPSALAQVPASAETAARGEREQREPASASLTLQLEVDFAAREARLRLEESGEPLRLVCEDGAWRIAPVQ